MNLESYVCLLQSIFCTQKCCPCNHNAPKYSYLLWHPLANSLSVSVTCSPLKLVACRALCNQSIVMNFGISFKWGGYWKFDVFGWVLLYSCLFLRSGIMFFLMHCAHFSMQGWLSIQNLFTFSSKFLSIIQFFPFPCGTSLTILSSYLLCHKMGIAGFLCPKNSKMYTGYSWTNQPSTILSSSFSIWWTNPFNVFIHIAKERTSICYAPPQRLQRFRLYEPKDALVLWGCSSKRISQECKWLQ